MATEDEAAFTFNWLALKLLGKGLYSNPWSALSELVANGIDAGAKTVYVYVDATSKSRAIIEVIDDGSGMDRHDIDTYVKVGHNKRQSAMISDPGNSTRFMGRKGIGKLAALFLSPHFYLQTRRGAESSMWELDAREGRVADSDNPKLRSVTSPESTPNDPLWEGLAHGTRLTLLDVDLTGYGPKAIEALDSRLANQFLLDDPSGPKILMWVRTDATKTKSSFAPVEKRIAFGNFAELRHAYTAGQTMPAEVATPATEVRLRARGLPGDVFVHSPAYRRFSINPAQDEAWSLVEADTNLIERTYQGIKFELTGWLAVHATIESNAAQENDDRFVKNKYYNPAQIRLYVRGKLASDRLLSQLGLTGTYANYIEGEISFDLLDDDRLRDISTSNRQDFDETDNRVTLLRALVRPIVRDLMQQRMKLADAMKAEIDRRKADQQAAGKQQFSRQVRRDLDFYEEIPNDVKDDLQSVIVNKIQGDVMTKTSFKVFISHSSADKPFADFIYETLLRCGARPDEVFYTSKTGSVEQYKDTRALSAVIKESIVDANTLIFYLTSRHFLGSEYCLFEGGAGWATRAVSDYLKLNLDYDSIPKFLTNGNSELTLISSANAIELRPDVHNYLIDCVLNPMIEHLNQGRSVRGEVLIDTLDYPAMPSPVELADRGELPRKYFNSVVEHYWQVLVDGKVAAYLADYKHT